MTGAASWREPDIGRATDGELPPQPVLALAPVVIETDGEPQLNVEAATVLARIIRADLAAGRLHRTLGTCRGDARDCEP
jgi:hypothetical protein